MAALKLKEPLTEEKKKNVAQIPWTSCFGVHCHSPCRKGVIHFSYSWQTVSMHIFSHIGKAPQHTTSCGITVSMLYM